MRALRRLRSLREVRGRGGPPQGARLPQNQVPSGPHSRPCRTTGDLSALEPLQLLRSLQILPLHMKSVIPLRRLASQMFESSESNVLLTPQVLPTLPHNAPNYILYAILYIVNDTDTHDAPGSCGCIPRASGQACWSVHLPRPATGDSIQCSCWHQQSISLFCVQTEAQKQHLSQFEVALQAAYIEIKKRATLFEVSPHTLECTWLTWLSFEVVFLSRDQTVADFHQHRDGMPWLSLPYADRRAPDLLQRFGVKSSAQPHLIVVSQVRCCSRLPVDQCLWATNE